MYGTDASEKTGWNRACSTSRSAPRSTSHSRQPVDLFRQTVSRNPVGRSIRQKKDSGRRFPNNGSPGYEPNPTPDLSKGAASGRRPLFCNPRGFRVRNPSVEELEAPAEIK